MTVPASAVPRGRTPIWTSAYTSLCAVIFLSYVNHTALLPVLPLHVASLGGTELAAGVVIASFSVASFALRPQVGWLVDDRGASLGLVAGCALLAAATIGLLVPSLVGLALVNAVRGVAWAGVNTGANALLAELAPADRRGEASGYFSLFQAGAAALAPSLALHWLGDGNGFGAVYVATGSIVVVAVLVSVLLRRRLAGREVLAVAAAPQVGRRHRWVARSSLRPSALLLIAVVGQPVMFGFMPLYALEVGLGPAAVVWFYVVFGTFALLGRSLLGGVSDRLSRGIALVWGFGLMVLALTAVTVADGPPMLLAVAALYALGQGLVLPAVTALAIDRADHRYLGTAMATFSAAFQVGMGIGGLAAGAAITAIGYRPTYLAMAAVTAVGCALTLRWWRDVNGSSSAMSSTGSAPDGRRDVRRSDASVATDPDLHEPSP